VLLVALDASHGGRVGGTIAAALGAVLGSPAVQQFLNNNTFGLYNLISTYLSQCTHAGGACGKVKDLTTNPNLIVPYLLSFYFRPENLATAVAALVVLAVGIRVGSWLVAAPPTPAFRGASPEAASTRSVFVLAALTGPRFIISLLVVSIFGRGESYSLENPRQIPLAVATYLWGTGLAELLWFVAVGMGLVDAIRGRRWVWVVALPASVLIVLAAPLIYTVAAAAIAIIGCLAKAIDAAQRRSWGWVFSLGSVAIILAVAVMGVPSAVFGFPDSTPSTAPPIYAVIVAGFALVGCLALAIGAAQQRRWGWVAGLGLIALLLVVAVVSLRDTTFYAHYTSRVLAIVAVALVGCLALAIGAARQRRWGWVAGLGLIALLLGLLLAAAVTSLPDVPTFLAFGILVETAPLVIYGLWTGPVQLWPQGNRGGAVFGALGLSMIWLVLFVAGGTIPWQALIVSATLVALIAWGLSLVTAAHAYQWGWVAAMGLLTVPLIAFTRGQRIPIGPSIPIIPTEVLASPDPWLLWSVPFIVAAVSYALWARVSVRLLDDRMTPRRVFPVLPLGVRRAAEVAAVFALLVGLVGWDLAPTISSIPARLVLTEFTLLPHRFDFTSGSSITAGPDGTIWFTDFTDCLCFPTIERISPSGHVQELSLPESSLVEGIKVGPDGSIWFADNGNGSIGRITASGNIQESYPPDNPGFPESITFGPDGNLWFTDYSGKIGRFDPFINGGAVQAFSLPGTDTTPAGITAGPDGNIWFTWSSATPASGIGLISPAGAPKLFPLSDPNNFSNATSMDNIVAAPDGNLWFTEDDAGKIGRIAPNGSLQEFPLPHSGSSPESITVGSDGNLWFTEFGGARIGRITPSGRITEFPLLNPIDAPESITLGPDGNLWFTIYLGRNHTGAIGRLLTRQADLFVGAG
jgi:streptogramin lyase